MSTVAKSTLPSGESLKHLIDDAGAMDQKIKGLKKQLDPAKEQLTDIFLALGVKQLDEGENFLVKASYSDVFETISPEALYDTLKARDLEAQFFNVIKVDLTALKKNDMIPGIVVKELQGKPIGTKLSLTFKEKE